MSRHTASVIAVAALLALGVALVAGPAPAAAMSAVRARGGVPLSNHRAWERVLQAQREAELAEAFGAAGEGDDPPGPPAHYVTQHLDHFNVANFNRTWQQRYWVNASFYKPGGPVFILVGGEGAESRYDVVYGEHVSLAQTHGAIVFALEHRYYGGSVPVPT